MCLQMLDTRFTRQLQVHEFNDVRGFLVAIFHDHLTSNTGDQSFRSLLCRRAWYHQIAEESRDPGSTFLEAKRSFLWTHRPNEHAWIPNVPNKEWLNRTSSPVPFYQTLHARRGQNRCRCCAATSGLSKNDVGGGEKEDEIYAEHFVNCTSESI